MEKLNESIVKSGANVYLLYSFLRRLTSPFKSWDAYKAGIIDEKGKILRPRKTLSSREKNDFSLFDLMILNMKKLLSRFSAGATTIASFAAAIYLLKEHEKYKGKLLKEEEFYPVIDEDKFYKIYEQLLESDGPTNTIGSGNIAKKTDHSTLLFKKNKKKRLEWQRHLSKRQ
jgi:hypothetical protein